MATGGRSANPAVKHDQHAIQPQTIRLAFDYLARELSGGARIFVFGSDAEGRVRADCNIDILVIEPEFKHRTTDTVRLLTLPRRHSRRRGGHELQHIYSPTVDSQ